MRIDFGKLIILSLFWFCLLGLPVDYIGFLQFFISISISYFLAYLLKIPSITNQLNWQSCGYFLWLLKEIFKSSYGMIKIILSPKIDISPGFSQINSTGQSELAQVIYANSITLTPGTVTVKADDGALFIHYLTKSALTGLQSGEMADKITKIIKPKL